MRTGRPTTPLRVTTQERDTLAQWARRRTTAQALAQRARIILACGKGQANSAVARTLQITPQTVCKWRQRFLADRLEVRTTMVRASEYRLTFRQQVRRRGESYPLVSGEVDVVAVGADGKLRELPAHLTCA